MQKETTRMANKENAKKLKTAALLAEVLTATTAKAKAALQSLKTYGDVTIIEPLIRFQGAEEGAELRADIHEFLADVHDDLAIPEFIRIAEEEDLAPFRNDVLNIIWNSKLDFSGYIDSIVTLAVEGDFMTAMECLTIIENMEGPFEELDIFECQLVLAKYPNHPSKSEQKDRLISDIAEFIQRAEREIEG